MYGLRHFENPVFRRLVVNKHSGQRECHSIPQCSFICVYSCIDLAIDVPDFLDLSRLRAIGLQASEEELPDLLPPIMLAEDTRGTEQVMHLCACVYIKIHVNTTKLKVG